MRAPAVTPASRLWTGCRIGLRLLGLLGVGYGLVAPALLAWWLVLGGMDVEWRQVCEALAAQPRGLALPLQHTLRRPGFVLGTLVCLVRLAWGWPWTARVRPT